MQNLFYGLAQMSAKADEAAAAGKGAETRNESRKARCKNRLNEEKYELETDELNTEA